MPKIIQGCLLSSYSLCLCISMAVSTLSVLITNNSVVRSKLAQEDLFLVSIYILLLEM